MACWYVKVGIKATFTTYKLITPTLGVDLSLASTMVRLSTLSLLTSAVSALASRRSPRQFADPQRRAIESQAANNGGVYERTTAPTVKFLNPKAKDYLVDGTKILEVSFGVCPSWSGM